MEDIPREVFKYFEENESTIYCNMYDAVNSMLKGRVTAFNAYLKKKKDLQSII